MNRTLFYTAALALSLAACSPSTPAPMTASVTVTGPSNAALKIESPTTLTAIAKDASGNPLQGKTFVWSSSNPQIATVDSNGLVTAFRWGEVQFTASSEGQSGQTVKFKTYGLEVYGGVARITNDIFTGITLRLRSADGQMVNDDVELQIKGPNTWNSGKTYIRKDLLSFGTPTFWAQGTPPVVGEYKAKLLYKGSEFTQTYRINDAISPLLTPQAIVFDTLTSDTINATWQPVVGAKSYLTMIDEATINPDGSTQIPYMLKAKSIGYGTTVKVSNLGLIVGKKIVFWVTAFDADLASLSDGNILPNQLNYSLNFITKTL